MSTVKSRTLKVDYLARVEGEGSLYVRIDRGNVSDVKLKIFEPPRFFEAFLQGRSFMEAPDITARICGICPVAYQMSAVHAMENAFGITVDGPLRELRRLLYCGEWIESHVLHVFLLHAPDFLCYQDAIQMAKDHPDLVEKALRLKKIGNDLMTLLGGREIHPVNVRVGGFYRVPRKHELTAIRDELQWGLDMAREMVRFTAAFEFPDFERPYEFVALRHPTEYPLCDGTLVSSSGRNITIQEYEKHFVEEHVAHSNALHSLLDGRPYYVGPMARYNLNYDRLPQQAREAAREADLETTVTNPFKSIVVRSVETVFACEEALRIIDQYEPSDRAAVDFEPRESRGCGCTEAPRGILYHRYTIGNDGMITSAKIVPPTSQNQRTIEEDLRQFVGQRINMPQKKLTWLCEQAIRNYDPCISCATHFLKLTVDRA